MTDAEYTEQALDHLDDLEDHVADRVMNKVDEATEWTEHRLENCRAIPTTNFEPATIERSSPGIGTKRRSSSRPSATGETSTIDTCRRDPPRSFSSAASNWSIPRLAAE